MPGALVICCLVAAAIAAGAPASAEPSSAPEVEALRLCDAADGVDGDARDVLLERALALATHAVRTTPDRPDAHFAVFCALGKQLDDRGVGWGTLGSIRRVRAAVDRTLELDPGHVDALVGKATMLLRLPRVLGGDREEALRCLERVYRIRPSHPMGAAMWSEVAGAQAAGAPR